VRNLSRKDSHIRITSSPCKIKHVRFYQHSETVPDGSCRWTESSQVTEVFHCNPDWKTQREDLPSSAEYPNHRDQKLDIPLISIITHICAREYQLLYVCPMSCVLQVNKQGLPTTVSSNPITVIAPHAMLTARKVITRKISMILDFSYIACNRAIMITCIMFQSNQILLRYCSSPPSIVVTTTLVSLPV